jgi:anti-sigma factor NepR-like protein
MPSSLQYPLDRHRALQRKWTRLLDELPEVPSHPCSRSLEPTRNPPDQCVWLSAIGQSLKSLYDDVLAAPIPPRLAALVAQLEVRGARG